MRRRLDVELVRRGLVTSRTRAAEAVEEGRVTVGGAPTRSVARQVDEHEAIVLSGDPPRFVSRGGEKLDAAALDRFAVDVRGLRTLDAGASTGGFTDCLLQRGAASVVAVDVGRAQLDWSLRQDARVMLLERTNLRGLELSDIGGEPCPVAVADLSFISLTLVAPALARLTTAAAELVLLVKPQFEAGRERVSRGGIVRDAAVHRAVLGDVVDGLDGAGIGVVAVMPSPLRGAAGNVEFLAHARKSAATVAPDSLDAAVAEAHRADHTGADFVSPSLGTVGLVPHRDRDQARTLAAHTVEWFESHGVKVRIPESDAVGLERVAVPVEEFAAGLDLAVSLGGDGTMLRTVDLVYDAGVPVLGVNVGQLGYLAEVEPVDLDAALGRLIAGDYEVADRMMLQVTIESSGPAAGRWWALNEAVLEKPHPGRLARLDVSINGSYFTSYAADGVIVATPTGSTAYSFSARGPIVSPRVRCILLTPVSPHMLFDRSLVLDAEEELALLVSDERPVLLTIDGRERGVLEPGDTVRCTGGPGPARVVTLGPRDFHQILKAKFGLSDR